MVFGLRRSYFMIVSNINNDDDAAYHILPTDGRGHDDVRLLFLQLVLSARQFTNYYEKKNFT